MAAAVLRFARIAANFSQISQPAYIRRSVCIESRQIGKGQQPVDQMGGLAWLLFAIMAQLAAGQGLLHEGYALMLIKDYNMVRTGWLTTRSVTPSRACARCQPTGCGRQGLQPDAVFLHLRAAGAATRGCRPL